MWKGTRLRLTLLARLQHSAAPTTPRFAELENLSQNSLRAIAELGFERCTAVQHQTLPGLLRGEDMLAKARTGTGKTVAFLLPTIERLAMDQQKASRGASPIRALVISPTRELAQQISVEADQLMKHHSRLRAGCVVGGTKVSKDIRMFSQGNLDLLVATPGRLEDHLNNTAGFAERLGGVQTLVLDEGDQLLDRGFRVAIERILQSLPASRQSLCFSATLPNSLQSVLQKALRSDHQFVDCVQETGDETNPLLEQSAAVVPLDDWMYTLHSLLTQEANAKPDDHKVIVFLPTARETQFVAEALQQAQLPCDVLQIHSRKSQSYRQKVSGQFRSAKKAILVSSDVSARGVDYPDVSLVLQLGAPASVEQYVHRVGRTGRSGKAGKAVLMLTPSEAKHFIPSLSQGKVPVTDIGAEGCAALLEQCNDQLVQKAVGKVSAQTKQKAYQAYLGNHNSALKALGWDKKQLVKNANAMATGLLGWDGPDPPPLEARMIGKMGLKGVTGLNVVGAKPRTVPGMHNKSANTKKRRVSPPKARSKHEFRPTER